MEKTVFEQFRDLIYKKSGINLKEGKDALLIARVSKRIKELNLSDMSSYYKYVCNDATGKEMVNLLNAVSTNVTHFFREIEHFDFMEAILSDQYKKGKRKFRIWSCACSTGEEPYSIGMSFANIINIMSVDLKILATDISTKVLDVAKRGEYSNKSLEAVPQKYRSSSFYKFSSKDQDVFHIPENIKKTISFCGLNLSKPPFPMNGPFDIVFCRNVMIYFDNIVRQQLINEIYRLLNPGAFLLVGHSESLAGIISDFKILKPSIYQKAEI